MIKMRDLPRNMNDTIGQPRCIVIAFPGVNPVVQYTTVPRIVMAPPGEQMPESIPDFRPQLQRDGLILLSWDKKLCMNGALYTAYWVTSSGILRYYASPSLYIEDFRSAMPNRKSYAAEDGIDFYGDPSPLYMVHVAPELMMSNREKINQRPHHINKLKELGATTNFDYNFLLKTEQNKKCPFQKVRDDNGGGRLRGA